MKWLSWLRGRNSVLSPGLGLLVFRQTEDLSRLYRLYCGIARGLEPIATIFRQVRRDEGRVHDKAWSRPWSLGPSARFPPSVA